MGVATVGGAYYAWDKHRPDPEATTPSPSTPPTTTQPRPTQPPKTTASAAPKINGNFFAEPSWRQQFANMPDGPVDSTAWNFDTDYRQPGKNNELQGYTNLPENARVEGGLLVIQALQRRHSYSDDPKKKVREYTSARLNTMDKFSFTHGKIEIDAKMPTGAGAWGAIWALPQNRAALPPLSAAEQNSSRAYIHGGEIDIAEYYGSRPGVSDGVLHTVEKMHKTSARGKFEDGLNTFGIELTPDRLAFTLNGEPCQEIAPTVRTPGAWPFEARHNNQLYLIANVAMGGNHNAGTIDPSDSPWTMGIADIRYYDLAG